MHRAHICTSPLCKPTTRHARRHLNPIESNLDKVRSNNTKEQRSDRDTSLSRSGARELRRRRRRGVEARGRGVAADRDAGARGHEGACAVLVRDSLGDGGVLRGGGLDGSGGGGLWLAWGVPLRSVSQNGGLKKGRWEHDDTYLGGAPPGRPVTVTVVVTVMWVVPALGHGVADETTTGAAMLEVVQSSLRATRSASQP